MFNDFKKDIKYRFKKLNFKSGDLERRLSIIFLFTGFLLSGLGFVTSILLGDSFLISLPNLVLVILCVAIPLFTDDLEKPTTILLYLVGFLFFPFLFFTMGGVLGSGFIYFILITIYFAFYLDGKKLVITNSLLLVLYISIIVFAYINPNIYFEPLDPLTHLINILIGVISVSVVISALASATFREYTNERAIITKLMIELETQNNKLTELSIKDQLTGVYNRRHFLSVLDNEIKHFKKYKQNFHVMMIDLDDFKKVNDTHGHLFGDEVLRKVAQQINKTTRDYDIISRYGGEEFCVIVSHLNPEDSFVIAERIRLHVENLKLRHNVQMTVSIGVTTYCEGDTSESVVRRADEFMYEAKGNGKNCVVNKEC